MKLRIIITMLIINSLLFCDWKNSFSAGVDTSLSGNLEYQYMFNKNIGVGIGKSQSVLFPTEDTLTLSTRYRFESCFYIKPQLYLYQDDYSKKYHAYGDVKLGFDPGAGIFFLYLEGSFFRNLFNNQNDIKRQNILGFGCGIRF